VLNPLTVLKGYQQLVDEQLVEKRRGRGMYVSSGARRPRCAATSGERFLDSEWPRLRATIARLGLSLQDLLRRTPARPRLSPPRRGTADANKDKTMATIIEAKNLSKRYGGFVALDQVSFSLQPGRIVGLIGRNGAGKTTALKAILGLTPYEGSCRCSGWTPRASAMQLMSEVCFIADVAVLPRWLRVSQAIDYVAGVHPRFDRERAEEVLATTDHPARQPHRELSKGMITQLHLALILAIDAKLLVLDEPTLGLDLLYRRQFYDTLLNDYFDKERTILLTTHQVEEVENLLTDVLFIDRGRVVLDAAVDSFAAALRPAHRGARPASRRRARWARSISARCSAAPSCCTRTGRRTAWPAWAKLRTPTVADLFVAMMQAAP
jgi:ABC-2 type transport system ATP-binding protein